MMNKTIIVAFAMALSVASYAQSKKELKLRDQFWSTEIREAQISEVPEAWKGESAVVLYKNIFYGYTNNGKKMYNPAYKHYRIKLMDQPAIERYSALSFDEDEKGYFLFPSLGRERTTVGVKIIKVDGSETIVDVEAEVISQDNQKKLAIPGLEVGDILDYFIYEDDYQKSFSGTYIYPPVENILSRKDPIVYSRLAIEVENDYFLNMESYNGAPAIVEEETDKRATRRYVLETRDIGKTEFPRWSYPYVELPAVKFQVTFALKAKNESTATVFLGDNDAERKTKVSKEEILEYYDGRFETYKKTIKDAVKFVKNKEITSPREQFEEAFYFARHKYYNKYIELYIASEELGLGATSCDGEYFSLTDNNFVNFMSGLARAFEIDYDVVVATAAYNGSIDDLLLKSNVAYGIRLNFEKPLYVFDLSPHAQLDRFPESLEGTKAFIMNVKKAKRLDGVSTAVLPVTQAADNVSKEEINITINDAFKGFNVGRTLTFSGYFKPENLSDRVFFGDYLNEEYKRYDTDHYYFCGKRQNKYEKTSEEKTLAAYVTYRENKLNILEERVGNSLDTPADDYAFEVLQTSRYTTAPLIIKDSFTIEDDYIKKAGPNYIVSVGKFIGGQVQLKKEEFERSRDIYIDYAKTFDYTVRIKIPEGYSIVGLDKLQKEIKNTTGSFVSKASIEQGELVIFTKKVYAKKSYKASEWPEMIKWLQAAYDLSQEKVMFKKV